MCGISSDQFDRFSRQVLEQHNAGELGPAVVANRIGGMPATGARERVTLGGLEQVIQALTGPQRG